MVALEAPQSRRANGRERRYSARNKGRRFIGESVGRAKRYFQKENEKNGTGKSRAGLDAAPRGE